MPIVDMPLEELQSYGGRNECPAGIDAYWDRAVAQMEALGTNCELTPSAFQIGDRAQLFDMYFTGVGGARIHARYARPRMQAGEKLPAVLLFHGYSGYAESFFSMLGYVCAGFAVAALDSRGQGGQSEDVGGVKGTTLRGHIIRGLDDPDPDKLLMRANFLDCAQLARIVMAMDEVDETRVGAAGGSQGGGLTLACAALTPNLNRAAPKYPFLCDYRRVWEMDLDVSAYEELRYFFRMFDPRHLREKEIFTRLGYIDNQHIAHRIRAQVLMFTGLMDEICPPSSQFAAYNKITSPKRVVIYPDYGHEYLPEAEEMTLEFMLEMKRG